MKKSTELPTKRLPKKDSNEHCNARTRYRQGYCRRISGWGTDHLRQGRCRLHGGSTPVKFGAFSKIIPKRHLSLLEDIKMDELSDLTHEIVKLKAYLIDLTHAEDVYEPLADVEGIGKVGEGKFSGLTEGEMLDYSVKIIGLLDKLISSINMERDRAGKRGDNHAELLKFITPVVDKFFQAIEASVKDLRVERSKIPQEVQKILDNETWEEMVN